MSVARATADTDQELGIVAEAPITNAKGAIAFAAVPTSVLVITSIVLFVFMSSLQPLMPDGDGLSHASRAIYSGFREGMIPQHLIAAAALRCVYLPVQALGLDRYVIWALAASSHLATIGTFVLLAGVIYPRFLADRAVSFWCALGVVLSFGVLSRGCAIEVYALALFIDVVLVAYCLIGDFSRTLPAILAGGLYALAIGVHITNVLIGPFALAIAVHRAGRPYAWKAIGWAAAGCLSGLTAMWYMLLVGRGASLWPPDVNVIIPKGEPFPRLGIAGHLIRAIYGFVCTIAYLPPLRDMHLGFAAAYVSALFAGSLTVLYVARRSWPFSSARLVPFLAPLALIVIPFGAMGFYYYPSDPERWLFLMPLLWLFIGILWDCYSPGPDALLRRQASRMLLAAVVIGLGCYNAVWGLLPDARTDRQLSSLKQLARRTASDDLVISPAGLTSPIYGYFIGRPLAFENLIIIDLGKEHLAAPADAQAELRSRITRHFKSGGRVFAAGLLDEGHVQARGYPWSFIPDYDPEVFLAVLREFDPKAVVPPSRSCGGIFELQASAATNTATRSDMGRR